MPAAGSGRRLGEATPKPFITIGGQAILEHTISRFIGLDGLVQIIVATAQESIPAVKEIFGRINTDAELLVVEGAEERQYSIANALQVLHTAAQLVAVHDAVRPFVKPTHILKCCELAQQSGGAVLGVPAKDTIKMADGEGVIISTPARKNLWQAQTPQVFKKELLLQAHEIALADGFFGTDDASLVERIGGKMKMVEGDRENLKITYPVDLKIAELILANE